MKRFKEKPASKADGVRLWIGNEPKPADREQIVISRSDNARIPPRGTRSSSVVTVTDLLTGKKVRLRRISCGLPHCYCAVGRA